MTLQTIQELRELEAKATEGPWEQGYDFEEGADNATKQIVRSKKEYVCGYEAGVAYCCDSDFIVSLRNNAKALLDMAEECLRLREAMDAASLAMRLSAAYLEWCIASGKHIPNYEHMEMEAIVKHREANGFTSAQEEQSVRDEASGGRTVLRDLTSWMVEHDFPMLLKRIREAEKIAGLR